MARKAAIRAHCLMPNNANQVVARIRDVEVIGGIEREPIGSGQGGAVVGGEA